MNRINIKKLAEALNISKSTVSRAFRDKDDINKETKEKILALAKELNFQPNHYASNLRDQRSKTIAVIIPELANNYFSQVIHAIEKYARSKNYQILIYVTDDDYKKEVSFIKNLYNGRVEGIIMSVSGEAEDHKYLLENSQIPLVFFDRVYEDIPTPRVITNDYESSFAATEHLIKQGCKHIAYLVINKNLSIGKTRLQGYSEALKKHHIEYNDDLVIDCSNSYKKNSAILKEALTRLKPDGIFSSVERLAFASYYACEKLKISIPEDLKIISFSSLEIAALLNPALSTITQPADEIGSEAARLLFNILEGKSQPENLEVVLQSKLIKRKSTATG